MIYDLTNTQLRKMLSNLNGILDKAAAHADAKKFEMGVLLSSRLAPDQFDLTRQIQILCDTAKRGAAFLTGTEEPKHPDTEKTLTELRARVDAVSKYLAGFKPAQYEAAAKQKVTTPRWEGQWLTGEEYVVNHMLPNFYFHLTTAYAILRHNGVDVGKKDYLGAMPFKK